MTVANMNSSPRTYRSPLRERQAAETRDRILAGLAQTMADGIAEVSMPAVAKSAGVSVATVYRHFPSKRALFEALPGYFARLVGMERPTLPASQAEFEDTIRHLFVMYERLDVVARAAMGSQLGDEAREAQMPQRLKDTGKAIGIVAPDLSLAARERIARLVLVLTASGAQRMLKHAGLGATEAADEVIGALRSLITAERAKLEWNATG